MGALDALECSDPKTLTFRAVARGVREIVGGLPGRSVPDLVWEDRLGTVLAHAVGVGNRPVVVAGDEPLLGGISAPSLAIGRAEGLRAVDPIPARS